MTGCTAKLSRNWADGGPSSEWLGDWYKQTRKPAWCTALAMEWRGLSPWHQKVSGRSRAEGWMSAEGCAHPSTVTVMLKRGQPRGCGPTPTRIAPRENGATRVWGSQDPEPVRSQVSANASLTKPGLPGTEGLVPCWQSEGKKEAASLTTHGDTA